MKRIIFKRIKVTNFFSYRDQELILDDKGLIAVCGKNGEGKSALITEAPAFALFGETIRKMSITKVPNRFSKGQCIVEFEFILNDTSYIIKRTRRPDSLQLYINNVLESEDDKAQGKSQDTTSKIKEIIKMDLDEFVNSILFGQNIQKYFFILKDSEQKDMLDNIIDILIYDKRKNASKKLLVQIEELLGKKETKLIEIDNLISGCTNRINDLLIKETEFLANKEKDYDILSNSLLKNIADSEVAVNGLKEKLIVIDTSVLADSKDKELKLVDGIGKLTTLMSSLKQVLIKRDTLPLHSDGTLLLIHPENISSVEDIVKEKDAINNFIMKLNSIILANNSIIEKYNKLMLNVEKLMNTECPTCGRLVDETCISQVGEANADVLQVAQEETANALKEIENSKHTLKLLDNVIIDRNNTKLFNEIISAQEDIKKYNNMKEILNTQLSIVQSQIVAINSNIATNNTINIQIASIDSNRTSLLLQLQNLNIERQNSIKEENPFVELKRKEEETIINYTTEITSVQKEMDAIKNLIEACKYWHKGYGDKNGIKSYIYKQVFPFLTERCNHYLSLLSNGEIRAEIGLDDKDRFIVNTDNTEGAESYGGNSGGEKRRIDLAVMFALHDLVANRKYKSNILILDEIFDSLDITGIDSAMALLEDLESQYDSIFVISHTDIQEYFDNHLYIIKEGNISKVVDSLD